MNYYTRLIPLTGLAAAIALGGPLTAAETAPKGPKMMDQQRQSQQAARTADRTSQASSRPMTASDVLGMNIDTAANEKIGAIDEIFIDSYTGEVLAMVVSTGGFLGMGQQHTLISPEDLRFNADRTLMQTDVSKDQMRSADPYRKGETEVLDRVRPLGKTRSNWDARYARAERSHMRPAAGVEQNSRGLAVSELIGMSVENRQGETVGKVDEVFLDLENREVVGVVVSTGGFLGMGDRKTLFGLRELSFDSANEMVLLDYNRDQIRVFPEYKLNEQSVFTALRERTDRLAPRTSGYKSSAGTRTEARKVGSSTPGRSSDMTVFDQGNSSEEIAMTASIRTAIRDDRALSSRANNVTIITSKGKVVLRGEVASAAEKATIEGIAHTKAGRQNVTSELIVSGTKQVNR